MVSWLLGRPPPGLRGMIGGAEDCGAAPRASARLGHAEECAELERGGGGGGAVAVALAAEVPGAPPSADPAPTAPAAPPAALCTAGIAPASRVVAGLWTDARPSCRARACDLDESLLSEPELPTL